MPESCREVLRGQFELVWSLFELHLDLLTAEDYLWEPAPVCWTMHSAEGGGWTPDWAETEPDPVPVPTIAWLTWHIGWWWSVSVDHAVGRPARERTEISWPGADCVVEWLRGLRADWLDALDRCTGLDGPAPFPWPAGSDRTVADMIAWANAELMKNVAEIGQLRLLRRAFS